MTTLSLIFPAYNEAERIGPTIESFHAKLKQLGYDFEIMVVDDGSTDNTVEYVKSLIAIYPELRVVETGVNRGKGHAVRRGMLLAKGAIRIFSDADGSTPASDLVKVIGPILAGDADLVIGSRYLQDSTVSVAQPWFRRIWSRWVNARVQNRLLPGIVDPHCGFKAYSAPTADKIFSKCEIDGWSFDLEALMLARFFKFRLVEVGVEWANDERTKGRLRQLPEEFRNVYNIKKRLAAV